MAAVAPPPALPQVVVDGRRIVLHPNKKEPRTPYQRLVDFMDTANGGPFRLGQLGDRFFKLLHTISPNENFKNISSTFNKMWTVTIIPRLFGVTKDAKDAIANIGKPAPDAEASRRKYVKVVNDVTDAGAAWGYASSLILACFKQTAELGLSVLKAADTITFIHDVADLQMNAEDFNKARIAAVRVQQMEGGEDVHKVQENLVQTQRFHLLKTIKAVCSIAGFILGLAVAASGLVLPGLAIAAASISLFATLCAMGSSLHEESMEYERTKFFSDKHVQRIEIPV